MAVSAAARGNVALWLGRKGRGAAPYYLITIQFRRVNSIGSRSIDQWDDRVRHAARSVRSIYVRTRARARSWVSLRGLRHLFSHTVEFYSTRLARVTSRTLPSVTGVAAVANTSICYAGIVTNDVVTSIHSLLLRNKISPRLRRCGDER